MNAIHYYRILGKRASVIPFVSVWKTDNTSTGSTGVNQIKLPLDPAGDFDFTADWGDGSLSTINSYNQAEATHTYENSGTYTVTLTGNVTGFKFGNAGDRLKIMNITQWGNLKLVESGGSYFYGCGNLNVTATDIPVFGVTNYSNFFRGCTSLVYNSSISNWDVSGIISLVSCFQSASQFNIDISNWDVSSVVSFRDLFRSAVAFNQPLEDWELTSADDLSGMFRSATSFNQPLNAWDVSNVTQFGNNNGSARAGMFEGASAFNQPLDNWDVSNGSTFFNMFQNASVFNQDISSWVFSTTKNIVFTSFFQGSPFTFDISSWNTGRVTDMDRMFWGTPFNQPLNAWDVSNVTTFKDMFRLSSFNQPLNLWDISAAFDLSGMFKSCPFNQDISGWDVSGVSIFGLTNGSASTGMFEGNTVFNQDISGWNVSAGSRFDRMFFGATAFVLNQDISGWNVANMINGTNMFLNTTMPTVNYDDLLITWSALPLKSNVVFHGGSATYSSSAATARQYIIDHFNWTITDGGPA